MLNRLLDVFKSFEFHEVRYLVIGGIAAILHGVPRATFDLDILIDKTEENARKLLEALAESGFATALMTNATEVADNEITIFTDRVRIDVQTLTPGITFEQAWARRVTADYSGQKLFILCKEDLITSKRASGRRVDLEDVRLLELL
jgi:hypothetical protein